MTKVIVFEFAAYATTQNTAPELVCHFARNQPAMAKLKMRTLG
jgi:hypothetical protein